MDAPLVEFEGVGFAYGDREILRDVNLSIARGQITAILGTSGCGKTTLLRLLGGQLKPSRGEVRFQGKAVAGMNEHELYAMRGQMGMMFQLGGLFTDMSVYDNIAFPLREHTDLGERLICDIVLMKLEAVGLRGARALMTSELSGGMARRVALARAIAMDPLLAIYDEPFAGLDPISLGVIANLIRRLNDALGVSSIVVSYDVSESLKVVDHLFLLAEGRIVAQGKPQEMLESQDPYARQFFHAQPDGPVPFQAPAPPYAKDFRFSAAQGKG